MYFGQAEAGVELLTTGTLRDREEVRPGTGREAGLGQVEDERHMDVTSVS